MADCVFQNFFFKNWCYVKSDKVALSGGSNEVKDYHDYFKIFIGFIETFHRSHIHPHNDYKHAHSKNNFI